MFVVMKGDVVAVVLLFLKVYLSEADPLSISVTPAEGSAIYGDASYTIQCTITGTKPTSWSWSKRPVAGGVVSPISAGGKYIIANSANAPHLTINNVVEDDEQDFFCQATNAAGTVTSSRARLIVNGGLLSIAISPSNADVLQGQSQMISCTATGTPSATDIAWRFTPSGASQQQTLSLGNTAKYSSGTTQNPSLIVLKFQSSDGGSYICSATNAVGTSSSTTSVLRYIQQLTISVSPSDGTAIYGDSSYTIQCSITGTPQASSWTWVRMTISGGTETPISTGSKYSIVNSATAPHLTINNVVEDDEQDYYCRATNVAGTQTSTRARLIVNGDPLSISVTPADGSAIYGDASYTIQCTITGTKPTSWSWSKRPVAGGVVSPISAGGKYIIANSANAPHLTINNVVEDDEQDFFCQATNVAGTVTSSRARLIVNGGLLSIAISPSNADVLQGQSQMISCTATGTPSATDIAWRFTPSGASQQQTLSLGNTAKYSSGTTQNPSLTVLNFQSSDGGSYICSATNAVGTSSSTTSVLRYIQQLTISVSPSDGTAIYGDSSYTIQCSITGTPQATSWTWVRITISGGTETPISTGSKYSIVNSATAPHLTINNVVEDDEQDYYCRATNVAGTQTSTRARLIVNGGLLSVSISPANADVFQGQSLLIRCIVNGNPAATSISWRFTPNGSNQQQTLSLGNTAKYSGGTIQTPSLTVLNFQSSDGGSYVCSATNAVGSQSSTTSILRFIQQLTISVSPSDGTAVYGTASYTIQCAITGTPQATSWTWQRRPQAGGSLTTISFGNKYSIVNSATAPHLTINNIVEDDEQDYFCGATNVAGSQTSSRARLSVTGDLLSVSISPANADVLQGQSKLITCIVSGNPASKSISWRFTPSGSNQQQTLSLDITAKYSGGNTQNPSLTVLNFQSSDGGSYVCSATNAVGTRSSTTSVLRYIQLLLVTVSPSDGTAVYGDSSYTIQCSITGTPQATSWTWTRRPTAGGSETTISAGTKYTIVNSATAPHLTINSIVEADEQDYFCAASNVAGTQTSTRARLTVTGGALTVTIPSSTYSVLLGNQISITCTVSGSPSATNVYWMKQQTNNGSFSNVDISGNNRYSGGTLNSPTLVITSAQFSDEGNYRCHGINAAGDTNSIVINLDVTGINGGWSSWDFWGACNVTCGTGKQSRRRACNNPAPANGGADCPGEEYDYKSCTRPACPVNGGWSSWISGACNVTCGTGQQSRRRYCNNPLQANGGAYCQGEEDDFISCTRSECANQQSGNMPIVVGTVISVLVIGILIPVLVIYAKRRWHNSKKEPDYEITDMTKVKAHIYGETHANHAYQNDQHTAEIEVTATDNQYSNEAHIVERYDVSDLTKRYQNRQYFQQSLRVEYKLLNDSTDDPKQLNSPYEIVNTGLRQDVNQLHLNSSTLNVLYTNNVSILLEPLQKDLAEQFWTIVDNQCVENIILLAKGNEKVSEFYPTLDDILIIKNFEIYLDSAERINKHIMLLTFKLQNKTTQSIRRIRMFKTNVSEYPTVQTLCFVVDKASETRCAAVLIINSKMADFSVCGVLTVCLNAIYAIKNGSLFSVLGNATMAKKSNSSFFKKFDDYELCYKVLEHYLEAVHTYDFIE